MAKHRQPEGRLRDEDIASTRLERRAGRIRPAFVVAGNHDPGAAVFQHDLGAAEHVAGRHETHRHIAGCQRLAIGKRLQRAAGRLAVALLHDRDRARCSEHPLVTRPGVITVPMGDHGARHRVDRVDVKIAGLAVEPGGGCLDPAPGPQRGKRASGTVWIRARAMVTMRAMAFRSRITIVPLPSSIQAALCQL